MLMLNLLRQKTMRKTMALNHPLGNKELLKKRQSNYLMNQLIILLMS